MAEEKSIAVTSAMDTPERTGDVSSQLPAGSSPVTISNRLIIVDSPSHNSSDPSLPANNLSVTATVAVEISSGQDSTAACVYVKVYIPGLTLEKSIAVTSRSDTPERMVEVSSQLPPGSSLVIISNRLTTVISPSNSLI